LAVASIPSDYDSNPMRWRSLDRSVQLAGDVHAEVAARLTAARAVPTLDVGGGDGELHRHLPDTWPIVTLDSSETMLADAAGRRVRARAEQLPIGDGRAGAVTMLWMLYHLEHPLVAIREAWRALRPGGLFIACTSAHSNDPELTDGYPPTSFDAEEAAEMVGQVFSDIEVERWDDKLTLLNDQEAVRRYCVHHMLPPSVADQVRAPLVLTKRGCLIYARR
jgi:ubiquinone/menaquinone biosynthesis C-methylase UbiE